MAFKNGKIELNEEERVIFGNALFEARKNNMDKPIAYVIDIARLKMPEDRRPGKMAGITSIKWLGIFIKAKEKETGLSLFTNDKIVFLKPDEQKTFAAACHRIRKEYPKLSWPEVFRQANDVMPAHRRISDSYVGPSGLKWLPPLLEELAKQDLQAEVEKRVLNFSKPDTKVKMQDSKPEPQKIAPIQPEPQPEPQQPAQQLNELPVECETPAPDTGMQSLESALIHAVVSTVKPILINILQSPQFAQALREAFKDPAPQIGSITKHPVITQALHQEKQTKRKIMILGLQSQQAQEISKEYGNVYDLRIFDNTVTTDRIRSNLSTCERAIIMTKFIGHHIQSAVKGHAGFTYCNGTVSALNDLLREWSAS